MEDFVVRSRAGSQGSSTNNGGPSDGAPRGDGQEPATGNGARKRSRDQDGEDGSSRDQDDGPIKLQRIQSPSPSTTPRKLACPYFRNNPEHHRQYRSCAGPGWASVHRVKEHVYRRHSKAIRCVRCGETFETNTALEEHYRLPERCEVKTMGLQPEELTLEQEKALRKRKKFASEEEKWRDMYRILFPSVDDDNDDDDAIPSPYYDDAPVQFADEFQRYEQYLHRELPQLVRRRLEEAVSGFTTPLENQLRSQLVDIVRNSQSELFRSYRPAAPTAITGMPRGEPRESSLGSLAFPPPSFGIIPNLESATVSTHHATSTTQLDFSALIDFSAYGEPPSMDEELARFSSTQVSSWAAETAITNFNNQTIFSDSGYGSRSNVDFQPSWGDDAAEMSDAAGKGKETQIPNLASDVNDCYEDY
ncbi:hypothetical protein B0H66DRAFT_469697 [Apodospora peruviana]|uniref:C2H2-type domain-containing protein n=1 Tax=Apodospora peruviana TaxID=516989 RepID=A0AAE0IU70_9PEZI|nr:hypothetical protein B0H66DRAFT_469697 [Apodospora peruviana]